MHNSQSAALGHHPFWGQRPSGPVSYLTFYWMIFAISISASILNFLIGDRFPLLSPVLQIAGLVTCGFAWLFARALFRPATTQERWPPLIVGALFLFGLILYIDTSTGANGALGFIAQLQAVFSSAMLLMPCIEAFDTRGGRQPERGFRLTFVGTYMALVGISLAFALPGLSDWQYQAYATLAAIALLGSTLAWRYRLRNPLPGAKKSGAKATNPDLARSINRVLQEEQVFLDPTIKVSSLAKLLDQPDYKISQCIVNDLGYANFNQLVNSYRLEAAKQQLSQPENAASSILNIAMDCGFGSLGPFNRVFKAQTGLTPSAFRRAALVA